MDKVCLFVICMYCSIHHLSAQQEAQQTQPVQQPLVTQDDILGNMNVDYAKINCYRKSYYRKRKGTGWGLSKPAEVLLTV